MDERTALLARLERIDSAEHHRQRLVIHLDEIAGVLGDVAVLGYHGGHAFAAVVHLLDRDHVLDDQTGAERRQGIRGLADAAGRDDGDHPGQLLGRVGADREDLRVRVRAADDRRVRHPRQLDVVDVAPLAA